MSGKVSLKIELVTTFRFHGRHPSQVKSWYVAHFSSDACDEHILQVKVGNLHGRIVQALHRIHTNDVNRSGHHDWIPRLVVQVCWAIPLRCEIAVWLRLQ